MTLAERRPRAPWYDSRWLASVLGLVVIGLVMAFSASYPNASRAGANSLPGDAFHYFKQHAQFVVIGLSMMVLMGALTPSFLQRRAPLAFGACLFLVVLTIGICLATGERQHGAMQWLRLGPVRFQPSEFAKLFFIVFVASRLSRGPVLGKSFPRVGSPILIATAVFGVLLLAQGDQGMAVLVFLIVLAMCYLGGVPVPQLGMALAGAGLCAAALALSSPERAERLQAWLNPVAHRTGHGAGYHILTMLVATSRGWIGGLGLGMCPDKWRQMPEPHTDSIFCVMGSELGLIGLTGFLALLGYLILRTFQIARFSRDPFGYFVVSGIAIMLGVQALINMAVATNLMPVTGLTLPYISYGGSSLISCLMAAGIVISVYRHNPALRKEG